MEYINDCKSQSIYILFGALILFSIIRIPNKNNNSNNENTHVNQKPTNKLFVNILALVVFVLPPFLDLSFYIDYSNSNVETKRIMLNKVTGEAIRPYSDYIGRGTASRAKYSSFIYDEDGNKYLVANELLESGFKNRLFARDYITIHYKETFRYNVVEDIDGLVFGEYVS